MSFFWRHPRLAEALVSAAILAGGYVAARVISFLVGRLLSQAAARTTTTLDDRLLGALKRPLTYALFLVAAFVAVHRLSIPAPWMTRIDNALFALGVVLLGLALMSAYGILLSWYTLESRYAESSALAREFGPLFSKLGKIFIGLIAVITVLQHLGVNVASLVVSLGVGSLAVGLAAQDTLANMFAGFTLMVDRPFKIGDRIRLSTGELGDVETIGIRATRIRTLDETLLVVPNSILVKERLVNQTLPTRQVTTRIDVGVAYGTDLASAKGVLVECAFSSRYVVKERVPLVLVTRFADFSIQLLLIFWARDYAEQGLAQTEVYEEIDRRFRERGIEIPYPVREIVTRRAEPAIAPGAPDDAASGSVTGRRTV
jgi:small-conductance mechanosensitive channel